MAFTHKSCCTSAQGVPFCGLMRTAVAVSAVFEPQLHAGIRALLSQLPQQLQLGTAQSCFVQLSASLA